MNDMLFNSNFDSMKRFLLSNLIQEQGVAKTPVEKDKVKEVYERLNEHAKDVFQHQHVKFTNLSPSQRKDLCVALMDKNFDKVTEIVQKALRPADPQKERSMSWDDVKADLSISEMEVDEKGVTAQTTNPVWFYSETGALSKDVPLKLVGVMKGRLSHGIDYNKKSSKIYQAFLDRGYKVGHPPPQAVVNEILNKYVPELYHGVIAEEAESLEKEIIESFTKIPIHLNDVLRELNLGEDHRNASQEIQESFINQGFGIDKLPAKEEVSEMLIKKYPSLMDNPNLENTVSKIIRAFAEDMRASIKGYEATEGSRNVVEGMMDVEVEQGRRRSASFMGSVLQEIDVRGSVPRGMEIVRDRYINTAMFSREFDEICGTNLTPNCTRQEVVLAVGVTDKKIMRENVRGIFQEKMTFVPLSKTTSELREKFHMEGKKAEELVQKSFEAIDPFLDTDSFQRAILRETELADADLHSGNVALVPKIGNNVIKEITHLNQIQLQQLLEGLTKAKQAGSIDINLVISIKENLVEAGLKKIGAENEKVKQQVDQFFSDLIGLKRGQKLDDSLIANKLGELAGLKGSSGLRFAIQLFDVDLTMPKSNMRGVTGGNPPVRNILLAFPKANDPLTPTVKEELLGRGEKMKDLLDSASMKFDKETVEAFQERMERLIKAGHEDLMTPRGLVWRAFPAYAEIEAAYDKMQEVDGEENIPSQKFDFIGFLQSTNGLVDMFTTMKIKIEAPKAFPINL